MQLLDQSVAERFRAEISGGWQRAMEMSYIALRRVRSGRRAPPAAIAAVEAVARAEASLAHVLLSSVPGAHRTEACVDIDK